MGYSHKAERQKQGPEPHGPALAEAVHDRPEQHAPHHEATGTPT